MSMKQAGALISFIYLFIVVGGILVLQDTQTTCGSWFPPTPAGSSHQTLLKLGSRYLYLLGHLVSS